MHLSCDEMCRALERHGWYRVRKGKHHIYAHSRRGNNVPVPNDGRRLLATGSQKKLMRDAGLTDADL